MSTKRVNLISLLALLFLVLVVAITPEARLLMSRLAFWMEGVEEKLETSRRERASGTQPTGEESRSAGEETSEPVQIPPHVVMGDDGRLNPEPGYSWINDAPDDHRVQWVPDAKHPEHPNVVASSEPDQWRPAAGYDWVEAKGIDDMRVVWKPGRRHSGQEHVLAAEKEGDWQPEPGYAWINDDPNDLTVAPTETRPPA
ncbi:MAG TPA: hypothetical protein VNM67_19485 [Thermoanaerobaculia bacterium]|jgi:hypothetical protein|nr:hypothetical protein [Thermoanaerobaculia bacterium]